MQKIIIAIDGYSSCGKSTVAKALAARLGYAYIDSGAMYRAVTLYCMRKKLVSNKGMDKEKIVKELKKIKLKFEYNPSSKASDTFLNNENVEREIRTLEVSEQVSKVSTIPEVRHRLAELQKEMGKKKGIVMDGRDIGTTIFPDAELKIFMTADNNIRTQRRLDELTSKGHQVTFDEVKQNLLDRDHQDTHRKESPLTKAKDAIVLDNSELTKEQQLDFVLRLMQDLFKAEPSELRVQA